jgi:kynureninase
MSEGAFDEVDDLGALRGAYRGFLGGGAQGRILLTGHSHGAWPDVSREALLRSFDDAARLVDDKWAEAVFPAMADVGSRILGRMGFHPGDAIAFGKSTHELVGRLLSGLPLKDRSRVVTTTGEFHSLHRQLSRLAEEGLPVTWVEAHPREGLAGRILEALTPGTALLAFSAVLFEDAYVVPRLDEIVGRAVAVGALPLVDAYHAFNIVPIEWGPAKEQLYVTAGGYKYAGFGEGLCWLRIPRDCALRPVDTGWFADFGALSRERSHTVAYDAGGNRFAGGTFDPSALYRARAALDHWDRFGLGVEKLRAISVRQTRRILARVEERGQGKRVVSSKEDARRGGFVTLRAAGAGAVVQRLRARGVSVDSRADRLRVGPAPFLTDEEIDRGVGAMLEEIERV